MRIITRQETANNVTARWKKQYKNPMYASSDKSDILTKLQALEDTPDPDQIDVIIGNKSWTRVTCHECDTEISPVIELGQEPNYDSYTACICLSCLTKAIKILNDIS